MSRLSTEDVMELLGEQSISGKPWPLERVRKWIERSASTKDKRYSP